MHERARSDLDIEAGLVFHGAEERGGLQGAKGSECLDSFHFFLVGAFASEAKRRDIEQIVRPWAILSNLSS